MPASEAQIRANQANSLKSCGPKTIEGKQRSRGNALKHGLTGEGVVLTNEDAAEVERTFEELDAEFRPSGPMGRTLVRRMATCIVRMERGVLQETAALDRRVLEAQTEAEANGEDPVQAGRRAMFDPSKEATLARKYEAAAERGMYRALKELRQIAKESKAPDMKSDTAAIRKQMDQLASFLPAVNPPSAAAKPAVAKPIPAGQSATSALPKPAKTTAPAWNSDFRGAFEVPITIGRVR